ncbi:MAG: peptide-methionine (S)-S-oxide reductase, partial [Janthinobacterium lividum]
EVFVRDAAQEGAARAYIAQLDAAHAFARPVATRVDPLGGFFPAEEHHQDFLARHPDFPYIAMFDMPKVAALRRLFPGQYVETPVTVGPA